MPPAGGKITPIDTATTQPTVFGRLVDAARYVITGVSPGNWFGPLDPLQPLAPPEVKGRQWDFPVGININYIPRGTEAVSFDDLRGLAYSLPLLRAVIETRKDQIASLDWIARPRDEKKGGKKTKAADDPASRRVADFLRRPDQQHPFSAWLRMILEELLVTDAVTLYPRKTRGGGLWAVEQIDGATIKPLINQDGRRPMPPDPAYQQILKGVPAADFSSEEMIYAPRNPRVHSLGYGFCYDDATEILTKARGFVRFADLRDGEDVATRSPSGEFQWQTHSRIIREAWDGPMYHFTSRSMDIAVTPEHRMLVTALPRALGGTKAGARAERVITAEQLARHGNREIKIPVTSTWIGAEIEAKLFVGEVSEERRIAVYAARGRATVGRRQARPFELSGDDYCALLGSYLAEGNLRAGGGIEVAQRVFSKGYGLYKALFERIGGSYNGRAFVLPRMAIDDHFAQFGKAHEKFIPAEILDATPRQLRIFWDHYIAGDGHYEARKNVSGRGAQPGVAERATTVSRRLADGLIEVAQKLGFSASMRVRKGGPQSFLGDRYVSECRDAYIVSCRYSRAMSVTAEQIAYKGAIHCVTVPNGIVYVRRNGKPTWSGNSPVEQVILTVNIALRRDVSTLEYYKSGSVPDAFGTLPKEYTVDQIKAFQDYFDALMAGDLARRRGLKFMPDTFKLVEARQPPLKDQYDEWLARIICYAFSVPISPFVNQVNRATGETLKLQATQEGLQPTKQWLKELLDLIIQQYLGEEDVEFAFNDQDENDPLQQAQTITTLVKGGVINRNEGRDQLGLEAIDGGDEFNIEVVGGLAPITVEEADTAPPPVDGEAPPAEANPDAAGADGEPGAKQGVGKAANTPFRRLDPIAFPRAATGKAEKAVKALWGPALARQAKAASASVTATLSKLGKASPDEESEDERRRKDIDAVVADLDLDLTASESDDLRAALADVASDASRLGYAQVGLGDIGDDLFEHLNEAALAWAEDHAAELVSQIGDTTREAVRQAIADGLDGNLSTAEIADSVASLGAFGEARALLIAETEVADANSKGALDGYKAARADGVAVLKEWLVDGNPCEACQENADAGPIDLDDDFPSGDAAPTAHPRCECALAPVVAGESEKFVASWAMSKSAPGRKALDALYEQTAQLAAAARIDRSYDVPYLSNRSKDGRTIYIDRRIPKTLKCGIAPAETLPWHELAEWSRQNAGDSYQVAHRQWADPIERRRVAELGGDWAAYSEDIAAYVREVDDEDVKRVPPDLDLRPYQDESDRKALSELARQK